MGKVLNLRNDTKMHLQNYKDAMLRMAGGMCVIEIIRDVYVGELNKGVTRHWNFKNRNKWDIIVLRRDYDEEGRLKMMYYGINEVLK